MAPLHRDLQGPYFVKPYTQNVTQKQTGQIAIVTSKTFTHNRGGYNCSSDISRSECYNITIGKSTYTKTADK